MADPKPSCPACGAQLPVQNRFTDLVVCEFCGQTSYVRDKRLEPVEKTATLTDYQSRIRVRAQGEIQGRKFTVLGRARYAYEGGSWDEWFLEFADGSPGWLAEDEGEYILFERSDVTGEAPSWESVRPGTRASIGGVNVFVTEKWSGKVAGAEGQLSLSAPPGRGVQYLDGNAAGKAVAVIYADGRATISLGKPVPFRTIVITESGDPYGA